MKYLAIFLILGIVLIISTFFIEEVIISKLDDTSKFKKWWRSKVVGVYEGEDF
jgi:hypothetical protein